MTASRGGATPPFGPMPLWRLGAFRRFWLGESISFVGNQVTELALPLTAVLLLGASAGQMGALTAVGFLPYLVFGLPAGVWVDRMRRQAVLVTLDLISAVAVLVVPLAAAIGLLRIELLYVVSFVLGSTVAIFTVAYQSFVPTLVGRDRIREANAALEASSSATAVAGPGIGGLLVQWIGAPFALLADGLSFLVSAALVGSIRVEEPPPIRSDVRGSSLSQIREGISYVASTPALAALVQGGTIHNFFSRMIDALFVLYATRELRLDAATIGLVIAAAGPGAFVGSMLASAVPARLGLGRTLWVAQVTTALAQVLIPVAGVVALAIDGGAVAANGAATTAAALVVAAGQVVLGIARSVFNVNQVSLRLSITPDRMHGRMNASVRFLMWSVTPFGALAGGALASTALGLEGTLFLASAGVLAATVPFLRPALRGLASIPVADAVGAPEDADSTRSSEASD